MLNLLKKVFTKEEEALPPQNWWKDGIPRYTPDITLLQRSEYQRVFVCDEMMKAHSMHRLLGEDKLSGANENLPQGKWTAITQDKFSLIRKNLGKFSSVIPLQQQYANAPFARVRGELYGIPSTHMEKLDNFKENGVVFTRERVKLLIPYRKLTQDWWAKDRERYEWAVSQTPYWDTSIDAWMYVGMPKIWDERLTRHLKTTYRLVNGNMLKVIKNNLYRPVKSFTPRNKLLEEYYYFSTYHDLGNN